MNYGTKERAVEVAAELNTRKGWPKFWAVFHRDGYWTVIESYLKPSSFGEVV